MIDVAQFINENKSNARNRTSVIATALNGGAPAYISLIKHGGRDYLKIYFLDKTTKKITNQLILANEDNLSNVLMPLIDEGAEYCKDIQIN